MICDGGPIDYVVVRSPRRRRTLSLTVNGVGDAQVAVPMRTSRAQIQALVLKHARWIVSQRARLAAAPPVPCLVSGLSVLFLGSPLSLEIERAPVRYARAEHSGDSLCVRVPEGLGDDGMEMAARRAIERWYRQRAAEHLAASTAAWGRVMQLQPSDVRVRDQRRRWGSCGRDGTLRFNWRLVMMPQWLIDYVVVHELAHLKVMNHSPAFWAEVGRFIPDYGFRRKQLNAVPVAPF